MNRFFIFFFFLFFVCISLSSQSQTVSIETTASCAGEEVTLDVTCSNLLNVIAITLYLDINPSCLTFIELNNINPKLGGFLYNYLADSNCLIIVWNDFNPVNLEQDKLFDFKCKVESTPGFITFPAKCEIADNDFNPIPVVYHNGIVNSASPVIVTQPSNLTITAGNNASFGVYSENASGYQWETTADQGATWNMVQDDEKFSGSSTTLLTISNVPLAFDNTMFRCILRNEECISTSADAALQVDSATSVNNLTNGKNILVKNLPNPFTESTIIDYYIPEEGNVHIRVYSMLGALVADLRNDFDTRGEHQVTFFSNSLPKGIYLCKIEYGTYNNKVLSVRKMIKN